MPLFVHSITACRPLKVGKQFSEIDWVHYSDLGPPVAVYWQHIHTRKPRRYIVSGFA